MILLSNLSPCGRFRPLWPVRTLGCALVLLGLCASLQAQGVADLAPPPIGGSPTPRAVPPLPTAPQPTPAHEEIPIPALTPQPQPTQPAGAASLVVTLSWGALEPLPVRVLDGVPYLADTDMQRLIKGMDPEASQQPNAAQATLDLVIAKQKILLFLTRNSVQINDTLLEAQEPLRVVGGQHYIPLRSLQIILDHYQDVQSNIPDLLSQVAGPVAQPTPAAAPGLPSPVSGVPAAPVSPPQTGGIGGGLGLAPPPLPDFLQADPRDIAEAVLSATQTDASDNSPLRGSLKLAAASLQTRRFFILDPQTGSNAFGSTADTPPSDLVFQIAMRCRELLAQVQTVEVYVTTRSAEENLSADQRLSALNSVGGKALISLRLDWSPFEDNRGYRIFTAHEAVDAEGLERQRAAFAATPGALPPPPGPPYLQYGDASRVLGALLDLQMKRINRIPPASAKPRALASFYLLKRAEMPAATLCLGYWSNPPDRSYLSSQDFVEEAAQALARTLVLYDRWLREI